MRDDVGVVVAVGAEEEADGEAVGSCGGGSVGDGGQAGGVGETGEDGDGRG